MLCKLGSPDIFGRASQDLIKQTVQKIIVLDRKQHAGQHERLANKICIVYRMIVCSVCAYSVHFLREKIPAMVRNLKPMKEVGKQQVEIGCAYVAGVLVASNSHSCHSR